MYYIVWLQILTPFLLRRLKTDVELNLPPKKEVLVFCPMTELQLQLYKATIDNVIDTLLNTKVRPCYIQRYRICSYYILHFPTTRFSRTTYPMLAMCNPTKLYIMDTNKNIGRQLYIIRNGRIGLCNNILYWERRSLSWFTSFYDR